RRPVDRAVGPGQDRGRAYEHALLEHEPAERAGEHHARPVVPVEHEAALVRARREDARPGGHLDGMRPRVDDEAPVEDGYAGPGEDDPDATAPPEPADRRGPLR